MKKIIKEVKRELYSVHLGFLKNFNFDKLIGQIEQSQDRKQTLRQILREYDPKRDLILDGIYKEIFRITGKPGVILDLACGLHPLAIPFMDLKSVEYYCYDVNKKQIEFLNKFFKIMNIKGEACWQDVISETPKKQADVAFLLKALTCFEWQEKQSSMKVLKELNAKNIVVSIPMRGPENKGGSEKFFKNLVGNTDWQITEITFQTEVFFIIKK